MLIQRIVRKVLLHFYPKIVLIKLSDGSSFSTEKMAPSLNKKTHNVIFFLESSTTESSVPMIQNLYWQ